MYIAPKIINPIMFQSVYDILSISVTFVFYERSVEHIVDTVVSESHFMVHNRPHNTQEAVFAALLLTLRLLDQKHHDLYLQLVDGSTTLPIV